MHPPRSSGRAIATSPRPAAHAIAAVGFSLLSLAESGSKIIFRFSILNGWSKKRALSLGQGSLIKKGNDLLSRVLP